MNSHDSLWVRYLKETDRYESYSGTCECASCTTARSGYAPWLEGQLRKSSAERDDLRTSLNICVGAAGIGDASELCGWIDRVKKERDQAQAGSGNKRAAACEQGRAALSSDCGKDERRENNPMKKGLFK